MKPYIHAPPNPTKPIPTLESTLIQPIPEARATTTKLMPITGYTIPIYQSSLEFSDRAYPAGSSI